MEIKGRKLVYLYSGILIAAMFVLAFVRVEGKEESTEKELEENEGQKKEIFFSRKSGFYSRDVVLSVSLAKGGRLYFTADGSKPDRADKEHTLLYQEPLRLKAGSEEQVYVYRFKAYYEDGTESEIYTNTYFVGSEIESRYDTLVMSVTAEEDDLYGYENGIFVEGKLREDWIRKNSEAEISYDTPANYNIRGRESEREIHIEIFEPDGKRIISQNGGIRISGNFTRQSEQKSFKIYARDEYDKEDKFRYPFFEDMRSPGNGSIIGKYNTLKIRNTGNDRSEGFIRDELGLTLAAQAGFEDTQSVRPAAVYINGAYQGLYWIHSTYDKEYFEEKYGEFEGDMVVIGNGETCMNTESDDAEENKYGRQYMAIYQKYSNADLTDNAVLLELDKKIDIKNYLRYFAIEVYLANRDWPYNNLQAYRYVASGKEYQQGTVFDGRYRYLLYDVDTSMGLGSVRDTLDAEQSLETLKMLEERNYAPLFTALMKREDCREYFASYLCDLGNGAFSPENVSRVLDELHTLRQNEMHRYAEESIKNEELPDISEIYLDMQMDCIRAWAETTQSTLLNGISELWQLGEPYSLHLQMKEGEGAMVNTLKIRDSEFTGTYFPGLTQISALVPEGREFSYWEINGEIYTEETIAIDKGMITDNAVYIALYTEEKSGNEGLVLSEIRAKGKGDYMILTNVSTEEINTWGYYLMDKTSASHMNYLEETWLAPGESLLVGCKNCTGEDSFMNVNFNIKEGKTVMLGSGMGIKERVEIPNLGLKNGVYKKDMLTGEWLEESEG